MNIRTPLRGLRIIPLEQVNREMSGDVTQEMLDAAAGVRIEITPQNELTAESVCATYRAMLAVRKVRDVTDADVLKALDVGGFGSEVDEQEWMRGVLKWAFENA